MVDYKQIKEEVNMESQSEYMVSIGRRPWGVYVVLANEMDVKVKRITVYKGHRLSLQKHFHRDEHWFIHKGCALINLNEEEVELKSGDSIDIPRNSIHRISNAGDADLEFIEIQTGEYFGEDDIIRLEDDYQR